MDIRATSNDTVRPDVDETRITFWTQHINSWRDSPLSQRAYARQQGLSIARFTYWKNKLYPNKPSAGKNFVPVRIAQPQRSIRLIHPSGVVLECVVGTDASWLRALMGLIDAS